MILQTAKIRKKIVFIYALNITQEDLRYSLLFQLTLRNTNKTMHNKYSAEIYFKYLSYPTPWKYDWKNKLPLDAMNMSYFIPNTYLKDTGAYYFAVWMHEWNYNFVAEEIFDELSVQVWKQICISKTGSYWSSESCHSLNSSNSDWIHCKCSGFEIAAFSTPMQLELLHIPIDDLYVTYLNIFSLSFLIIFFVIYFALLVLNYRKDGMKLLTKGPIHLRNNSSDHKFHYLICIKTGMYYSSGTTASVFIVLHGMNGVTESRQVIGYNMKQYSFQKGATDLFLFSTNEDLGPLVKIEIMHNNTGLSPSWYLKSILIKDLLTGYNYTFNCFKWLSANKEDCVIEKELVLTDTALSFSSIFTDSFITYIHDCNMWISVLCNSPATFFTGVQRLTCCLCYILNCILIFTFLPNKILNEEESKDEYLHLSLESVLFCLIASSMATLPQILQTVLFRFSIPPSLNLHPHFNKLFCSFSFRTLYCWLQQKRSNSSRSSNMSSAGTDGSDSLYSSFEESSMISMSNILEESFSFDEKNNLSVSTSTPDINEPISPLQKSISTWQAFENWVRKKHDLILSNEGSARQHLYPEKPDSAMAADEILLEELEHYDNNSVHGSNESLSSATTSFISRSTSQKTGSIYSYDENSTFENNKNDLKLQLLFLHSSFYYIAWLLVISNVILCLVFIIINTTRFSFIKWAYLLKYMLMSVLYSCLLWTPLIILLVTVVASLKQYFDQNLPIFPSSNDSSKEFHSGFESSHKRMEYFKTYLRPPKEEILERFRQCSIREKIICTFYSYTWKFMAVFILLLVLLLPTNNQNKFLQQSAIQRSLFSLKNEIFLKTGTTEMYLIKWLHTDFSKKLFDEDLNYGISYSTGCILVGNVVVKLFEKQKDESDSYNYEFYSYPSANYNSIHECKHQNLQIYHNNYYKENTTVYFDNEVNAIREISKIQNHLRNIPTGALSVNFILFNPTFSLLNYVKIVFEFSQNNIFTFKELSNVTLIDMQSMPYYVKFIFHLLYLFLVLLSCKTQCWQLFKQQKIFWENLWNSYDLTFNLISLSYLFIYFTFIVELKTILMFIKKSKFESNLDLNNVSTLETISQNLLAFLLFMHLISSFRFLSFSYKLKLFLKRLFHLKKLLVGIFGIFIIILCILDIEKRNISFESSKHPLLICLSCIGYFFEGLGKPEISSKNNTLDKLISIIISFILVTIYICLFSIIRAILIENKPAKQRKIHKILPLKETSKVFNKKLKKFFNPEKPPIVLKENYTLPVEFLLLELEDLTEKLLKKADNLCTKDVCQTTSEMANISNAKDYSVEELNIDENYKSMLEASVAALPNNQDIPIIPNSNQNIIDEIAKKLSITVPSSSKVKKRMNLPISLNASLASQRKFRHDSNINLSGSLQCHKIRKTYPLCHFDSESSSVSDSSSESNKVPEFTLRKTKSKGKGKSSDLDLHFSDEPS